MKNPKLKQEIVLLLAVGIGIAVILNIVYDFEPFSFQYLTEMTSQELDLTIPDDNFVRFALAVQFGYDMLPTLAQQFTISAITVQLLMTGFSPLVLAVLSAIGLLIGQMTKPRAPTMLAYTGQVWVCTTWSLKVMRRQPSIVVITLSRPELNCPSGHPLTRLSAWSTTGVTLMLS